MPVPFAAPTPVPFAAPIPVPLAAPIPLPGVELSGEGVLTGVALRLAVCDSARPENDSSRTAITIGRERRPRSSCSVKDLLIPCPPPASLHPVNSYRVALHT